MKTRWMLVCILFLALLVPGCKSRSYLLESQLVELAQKYQELFAQDKFEEILPMLSGDQLTAMNNALPVLAATASKIDTEITDWKGTCDFMNRDKTRGSVTATYIQRQTVKDVGTLTEEFSTVYEFAKIGEEWKLYSVKIMNKTAK